MKNTVFILMMCCACFADWGSGDSSNLNSIKSNVSNIESYSRQSYEYLYLISDNLQNNLYSIKSDLQGYTQYMMNRNDDYYEAMENGYDSYSYVNTGNGGSTTLNGNTLKQAIGRVMPANMDYTTTGNWTILFNRVTDRTYEYRKFLANIKNEIGGSVDDFIDDWKIGHHFNEIYNYNNELVNGMRNEGAVSEADLNSANKDFNKVVSIANYANTLFANYTPDNDVLFTLDFSSLGYALSRLTGGGNAWTDFQLDVSLNPTNERKCLKSLHEAWTGFYNGKGIIVIQFSFILITLLMLWNQFKSIIGMD